MLTYHLLLFEAQLREPFPRNVDLFSFLSLLTFREETSKKAVSKKGGFGEYALILVFGTGEHPNVPLFLVCQPVGFLCQIFGRENQIL